MSQIGRKAVFTDSQRRRVPTAAQDTSGKVEPQAKPPPSYAPVYAAALYPELAKIAREHGYALTVHGSLQRDLDLIAIPWSLVKLPSRPETVVQAFLAAFAIRRVGEFHEHPHGRMVQTLSVGHGECAIDLGFMPATSYAD